jgi:3D-(3,5/4)-trihydroxycyclohexane-1,2-dione acylhydrolase (decyclizing)
MKTIRLTAAQALVRALIAQRTVIDGKDAPLFAGAFAIFGHGNVAALGEALYENRERLPVWRGQNEQSMALAAIGFAKAKQRRQMMIATSSIGPGAANMVTAAAVAHANRLPVLLLPGDVFASRRPDPVLQQVEHFGDPGITVNDCFRPVSRFFDRIQRPEQLIASLPQAIATLTDPADCGPVTLALPQDVQAEAADFPVAMFEPRVHQLRRPRPDRDELAAAVALLKRAKAPLIVAGGGVHYALANEALGAFAARHRIPVTETQAGRAVLAWDHPWNLGPLGVIGSSAANALAAEADVVLAIGTRLADFATASMSIFGRDDVALIGLNVARFDAVKRAAQPLVADAKVGLEELSAALGDWAAPAAWGEGGRRRMVEWNQAIDKVRSPTNAAVATYAQVLGVVNDRARKDDIVVSAAGGLPGEMSKAWRPPAAGGYDVEYGFSCMGYEIAGALGAKMAHPGREVIVFVGDGSYLMMNSELLSSVATGHKLIVVVCDNGGFAVIRRLQMATGNASFNNLFADARAVRAWTVDFAAHARAMGAVAERVASLAELGPAFERARQADRSAVIVIDVDANGWTEPGGAWWEVAIPEVSGRAEVRAARAAYEQARGSQRLLVGRGDPR